jgi:hypothetical protein
MWKRIRSKTSSVYTRVRLRASISLSRLSRTAAGEEFTSSAPVDLTSTFAQTGPRTPDESTDSRVETGQLGGNDLNHHVRTMGSGGNTKSNSSLLTHDSWGDDVATPSETYVQSYSNLITGTMPDSDRRTQLLATLGECRTPSDVIGALRLWEERMTGAGFEEPVAGETLEDGASTPHRIRQAMLEAQRGVDGRAATNGR